MKILRSLLSIVVATYMTGAGNLLLAQETNASPFSVTLAPLQYASVKGNIGKFEALNWMPDGGVEGGSISFVKDINKDISLSVEGSEYTNDNGNGQLILQDGDKAFLQIDYNAFRKYYDGISGDYPYKYETTSYTLPNSLQGVEPNSPDLQMDISYFKLETGLGPISDPFLDVSYQHNSKDGDKSMLEYGSAYFYNGSAITTNIKKLGPGWESVNDTTDIVTLKEKKDFAGITFKGEQTAEVDYNHNIVYSQYLSNSTTGSSSQLDTTDESPNAKLFGSGVRAEKWMLNDNTYAALGYHYNHVGDSDLLLNQLTYPTSIAGVITLVPQATRGASLWSSSKASEDDHVWVGNINSNLTPNLAFIADTRYEHMGSEGSSNYYANTSGTPGVTVSDIDGAQMENHQDQTGEHVAFRYFGIPHTTLYTEAEFEQERNWVSYNYTDLTSAAANNFSLSRLNRVQDESWTVGGRIVPNRFFTFSSQVKVHDNQSNYDNISHSINASSYILMDSLREKGVDETSTLTWKPYHWLQNSLKYQFSDTVFNPQLAALDSASADLLPADGHFNITENHMLTSTFTYDISVQPIDPLLLMLTYSHVENYVRTVGASSDGTLAEGGPTFIPTFNSGDNSWLFSSSYAPMDNLVWTNVACYTISDNYVDNTIGVPLGTSFRELNFTTGLDYTYHKWLKIGPKYEHASYRDNPLIGTGNYSANIFMLTGKFSW